MSNYWIGWNAKYERPGFGPIKVWLFPFRVHYYWKPVPMLHIAIGPLHFEVAFWWRSFVFEWKYHSPAPPDNEDAK